MKYGLFFFNLSIFFFCITLTANVMSTVLLPGLKPHCACGRISSAIIMSLSSMTPANIFACYREERDAPVISTICFTALVFVNCHYECVSEIIRNFLFPPHRWDNVVKRFQCFGAATLSISTGMMSLPEALPELVSLIAFNDFFHGTRSVEILQEGTLGN